MYSVQVLHSLLAKSWLQNIGTYGQIVSTNWHWSTGPLRMLNVVTVVVHNSDKVSNEQAVK